MGSDVRRAAIETGQEQENVNLTGQISAKSIALSKVMSLEEMEDLERKMLAAMEAERQGKTIEVAPTVAGEKKSVRKTAVPPASLPGEAEHWDTVPHSG
jgi:hypothetical protein